MLGKLFKIIKKNFKLLIRSKSSALVIILGPLLVIFLVGMAFDTMNKFSLNIGTYSDSYSELTESFIKKLQDKEFQVEKVDSEEDCINQIKQEKLHTCIIFPPGLTIESEQMNEIVFHVDYSKINLVFMVLETISTKLKQRSSELSMQMTSTLIEKLESTKMEVYDRKPDVVNLKTENQQLTEKIDSFSTSIGEFKTSSSEFKDYMLAKVQAIKKSLSDAKNIVNGSNATSSQINQINMKLSSIDTLIYNIESKINDPNNIVEDDWNEISSQITAIETEVGSIKDLLSSSSQKLDRLQTSLNNIYSSIEGIKVKEAATIVKPITTNIKPVVPEKTYLNYLFPSLIVLVIMFISILLSTTIVMMEKHSPAYFRNFITPTSNFTFILATYLTNVILVAFQLIIIIVISIKFFGAQLIPSLQVIAPGLILVTTLFTLIGMVIGYIFNSEETATLASISTGSVFMFLSNVILPLESMPEYIRNIAEFNPFVIAESILRKAIIFKADFAALQNELLLLLAYSAVLFVIIWTFQKSIRKHLFHKLFQRKKKTKKKK
ncbi:hypothetical protein GF336_06890 [Candidatus Woesearchaeota archaeon]|nr:hypothetical protein [Candidatus Woesearchaeota archaeon]